MTRCTRVDPNASAEAKQHARAVLEGHTHSVDADAEEHQKRVNAGYKAALHSESPSLRDDCLFVPGSHRSPRLLLDPNVGPEAKAHAKEYLHEHGEL